MPAGHLLRPEALADSVRQVVREVSGDHDAPSTLLRVAVLGSSDQLVEVEAVAVRR